MNIAVNSGNIGTPVALQLAREGHQVTLLVRKPQLHAEWDRLGVHQTAVDINDIVSITEALNGHDAFFSVSPLIQNLVEVGEKAALAAKAAGIRKIVRASAQGAAPDAAIELGRMHYAVEKAMQETGIAVTVIRPANFMQNYLTFGTPESIQTQSVFYAAQGDAKVSIVDTRDISAVAALLITEDGHDGKQYDITGGESLSNYDIANIFTEALGRKITYISIPQEKADEAMTAAGTPAWLITLISGLSRIGAAGYLAAVKPDLELLLKRKPITFAQFLKDNLATFQPGKGITQ